MTDAHLAQSQSSRRFTNAWVIAFAGAGLEIVQWAGARPLWLDEEMIALNLRDRGLVDLAGRLWLDQSAPFGWLALQRCALLMLGTGERALRLVPVLFGLGTLATAVWIGRRWMRPLGAALFVLLIAFGQWISFYILELKHYSSDIFWSLLLPALAVWATEAPAGEPDAGRAAGAAFRRASVWWLVAAVAQWFSNGALLVMPACALALIAAAWRRGDWRVAMRAAAPGLLWVALFGLHYVSALRYTVGSDALQGYWSFALPPAAAGIGGTLTWLARQLAPFAIKPGGATLWVPFWIAVVAGIALLIRDRFALALVIGLIPLSAFALAAFRVAPLFERLSLWVVPALYLAVATSADEGVALLRTRWAQRRWIGVGLAAIAATVGVGVSIDLVVQGFYDLQINRPRSSNHDLNDREALQWLTSLRQPNDGLVTTHLGLPAVWWYGGVPISGPYLGGGYQHDGGRVFEIEYLSSGLICGPRALRDQIGTPRPPRVLVYFGFRFDDVPANFDDKALDDLRGLGSIVADRQFEGASRAVIVDLRLPPDRPGIPGHADSSPSGAPASSRGCVAIEPAHRW